MRAPRLIVIIATDAVIDRTRRQNRLGNPGIAMFVYRLPGDTLAPVVNSHLFSGRRRNMRSAVRSVCPDP